MIQQVLTNQAQRVLRHELEESGDLDTLCQAMERTNEKLRLHLAKLMGRDGFTLLFVRAHLFAQAEFPWLKRIQVDKEGTLKGLPLAVDQQDIAEVRTGFIAILSHLYSLLVSFIGEPLTLRLLQGIWPEIDLGGSNLGQGESTEPTTNANT